MKGRVGRGLFALGTTIFLLVGLQVAASAPPASADARCQPGQPGPGSLGYYHAYSLGQWCDGTAATQIHLAWYNVPISVSDANDWRQGGPANQGGHIDDEVWVYTQNGTVNVYFETGTWNGYNNTGQEAEWLWWSDTNYGTYYNHFTADVVPYNSQNQILIYYGNNGVWYAESDLTAYQAYAASTIQAGVYAWQWTTGMEEYDSDNDSFPPNTLIDADESSGTFHNDLEVWSPQSAWHYPTDTGGYQTQPCGGPPYNEVQGNTGRWPNGYCMNGVSYGAGDWWNNLP